MPRMDETNVRILQLLQKNARMSLTDLAHAVGRSETTVRERVTSLELGGYLIGYEARVDWDQVGLPALAVIHARCDMSRAAEVAKQLAAIPNVTRALLLTGPKPILAMLRVRDLQHLQRILKERLAPGDLTDIEVQIALDSLVERRAPTITEPGSLDETDGAYEASHETPTPVTGKGVIATPGATMRAPEARTGTTGRR